MCSQVDLARLRGQVLPIPTIQVSTPPAGALLLAYTRSGAYTDCYSAKLAQPVSLAEFMAAFYATPVFQLERWLLQHLWHAPSSDQDVQALAQGEASTLAVWRVESREANQAILAAGRTRSWFLVASSSQQVGEATTLYFGSAVVARSGGGLGWQFRALLGLHKLYARILLGAAVRRLADRGA